MSESSDGSVTESIKQIKGLIQSGQFLSALQETQQALSNNPEDIELLYLAAVSGRYAQELSKARDYLNRLLSLKPDYGRAYQELGHLAKVSEGTVKACEHYQTAVKLNPALTASWQNLYELAKSEEIRDTAHKNIHYLNTLPKILITVMSHLHEGRLASAEKYCRAFLKQQPRHLEAIRFLANIAEKNHVLDDAEYLLETILLQKPDHLWARFDYINVLHRRQKFESALQEARKLQHYLPNDFSVRFSLANQLAATGAYTEALAHYAELQVQEEDNPILALLMGHTFKTCGKTSEAVEQYQRAFRSLPTLGDAYWSLANLKTYQFDDQTLAQMESVLDEPVTVEDQIHIHFALGKAYEDRQEHDTSFKHYRAGNELKKQHRNFSIDFVLHEMQEQKRIFNPSALPEDSGLQAQDPIFVLGMPRAGSTLVEQILASHSDIDGTIELPNIISYVQELNGRQGRNETGKYPDCLTALPKDKLAEYGQRYLDETQVFRQGGTLFIDKMPNNFRHIGFIKQILPRAKIIDARRDPLSCCFSVYKQLFAEGQEFSYDLEDLSKYYQSYVDLMTHWEACYPGQIYRVLYQDMVANPEQQIERLLNFIGVPMESACLNFHTNQRPVRTASSEQVRQPIYKKSLAPWKPYERHLRPLLKAFDPGKYG